MMMPPLQALIFFSCLGGLVVLIWLLSMASIAVGNLMQVDNKEASEPSRRDATDKAIAKYTKWLAVFTGFLVLANILLFVSGERSIEVARRSVAKNALVASNRPWIRADVTVAGQIFYNVNGVNFTLRYALKNVGHSPATNIWVDPRVFAPAIGVDAVFNSRAELQKIIATHKSQIDSPLGFALFPDEIATQNVTVSIGQDELKRITQKVPFIVPTIIGTIAYRMGFDTQVHQTGFVVRVQRHTSPRPDRSASSIFPDEGDVAADNIKLMGSSLEGGYAD